MSDITAASRHDLLPAKNNVALGDNATYWMDVSNDRFVHFTTASRADAIARSKKLLQNPPDTKKFGPDAVFGISTTYGKYVPGTQTIHTRATDEDPLVAIVFTTTDTPKVGFVEEVIWPHDVHLRTVDVVSAARGAAMINASPENLDDNDLVVYTPDQEPSTAIRVAARFQAVKG